MQEISCKEFDSSLAEYVEGGLQQDVRKGMASHSLRCRRCRALLDDVKSRLTDTGRESEALTNPRLEAFLQSIPRVESDLSCPNFEELISDFLDGFVHASVYHKFASHSDACSKCSRVLTDVVYAVAACHSVHTYEEQEIPQSLVSRLTSIGIDSDPAEAAVSGLTRAGHRSFGRPGAALSRFVGRMALRMSVERAATVCGLLLASLAIATLGPARDTMLSAMFKKAHSRATSFYNHGMDIYSQREIVEARFERVGEDLEKVWRALGGTDSMPGEVDHGARVQGQESDRSSRPER